MIAEREQDTALAAPRHLANAPITEVILDVRVKANQTLEAETFRQLLPAFSGVFPVVEERRFVQSRLEFERGQPKPPQIAAGLQGFFLRSVDGRFIVQLRVDGFTFNRLRPYTSWNELFPVFWRSWEIYRDFAHPQLVTRLAARFINHIQLPADVKDFDDYVVAAPQLPDGVPPFLSGFFSQIVIRDPDKEVAATVRQSLEIDLHSRVPTLLLDVDAFKAVELDANDEEVARSFDALHDYKNLVFFGSLTEEALRLFQ